MESDEKNLKDELTSWKELAGVASNHTELVAAAHQLSEWIEAKHRYIVLPDHCTSYVPTTFPFLC